MQNEILIWNQSIHKTYLIIDHCIRYGLYSVCLYWNENQNLIAIGYSE